MWPRGRAVAMCDMEGWIDGGRGKGRDEPTAPEFWRWLQRKTRTHTQGERDGLWNKKQMQILKGRRKEEISPNLRNKDWKNAPETDMSAGRLNKKAALYEDIRAIPTAENQICELNPQIPTSSHNYKCPPPPIIAQSKQTKCGTWREKGEENRRAPSEAGTPYQSEVCSSCPVAEVTLCLMNQQYKTISSSRNVIGRRKVHGSLTTWPPLIDPQPVLSELILYPHLSQTNGPHTCSKSQSVVTQPQATKKSSSSGHLPSLKLWKSQLFILLYKNIEGDRGGKISQTLPQIFVQSQLLRWICCRIAEAWLMRCWACPNTKQQAILKSFWKSLTPSL